MYFLCFVLYRLIRHLWTNDTIIFHAECENVGDDADAWIPRSARFTKSADELEREIKEYRIMWRENNQRVNAHFLQRAG